MIILIHPDRTVSSHSFLSTLKMIQMYEEGCTVLRVLEHQLMRLEMAHVPDDNEEVIQCLWVDIDDPPIDFEEFMFEDKDNVPG